MPAIVVFSSTLINAGAGDTRLADAAMRGDRQAVRELVKQAANVNEAQGDGMTALHWAASNGDFDMAQLLVAAGGNVRATTRLGNITPILLGAQSGNARIVDLLLAAGSDANAATSLGVTPLMMAASAGSPEAIASLVARGANPNAAENTYGQTPLMFAAANNNARAIETLVEVGADVSLATKIRQPGGGRGGRGGGGGRGAGARGGAGAAASVGAPATGRAGGRGGRGGRGANAAAADQDQTPQASQTPQQGQTQQGQTQSPVAPAAPAAAQTPSPAGQTTSPARPTQAAAQPAQGASAGAAAGPPAREGSNDQNAGNPEEPRAAQEAMGGLTPLHYAVRQGHLEAVRTLLDRGSTIDELTGDRTTPLMLATINGRFDLAMYLLERGANPNLATVAGGTPLYRVVDLQWAPKSFYPQPDIRQQRVSYLELMRALLSRGANPNVRLARGLWYTTYGFDLDALDPAGATPFWRAAQAGDLDAMRLLVTHGADPKLGTNDNVTPLLALAGDGFHGNDAIVVPAGRMPAMRYLVEELEADVNAVDERGGATTSILHQNTRAYSAVHAAAARGDNEMILYLVSKGARVDLVGKNGLTAADMANSPRERIEPFPETIALLIKLGSKFSNRCISC
jgi:ankyrin repeat protein